MGGVGIVAAVGTVDRSIAAAAQVAWYIDGANSTGLARDTNSGLDATHPLLTFGERQARIGSRDITVASRVYLLSSQADATDVFDWNCLAHGSILYLDGEAGRATLITSTGATAVTIANPATNTPWTLTDTAVTDFATAGPGAASLVGHRMRWPGSGAVAWIVARISAHVVRISQPQILFTATPSIAVPYPDQLTDYTPTVGAAYVIESLPRIAQFAPTMPPCSDALVAGFGARVVVSGVDLSDPSGATYNAAEIPCAAGTNAVVRFQGCNVDGLTGRWTGHGVRTTNFWGPSAGSSVVMWASALFGDIVVAAGTRLYLAGGTIVQGDASSGGGAGVEVSAQGALYVSNVGVFGATIGAGVQVDYMGACQVAGGGLWGSGNATTGVAVDSGGQVIWTATRPTITGAGGDAYCGGVAGVGGVLRAWSALAAPGSIGAVPPFTLSMGATLATGAGSRVCAAALVGDVVASALDAATLADVSADVEATITVAGHVQQSAGAHGLALLALRRGV